jgi:beta-lactamase regulating signal transducer with metallopeptidase domain
MLNRFKIERRVAVPIVFGARIFLVLLKQKFFTTMIEKLLRLIGVH